METCTDAVDGARTPVTRLLTAESAMGRIAALAIALIALVGGLSFLPTNANAASFDCKKAATRVEKLICADPHLSKVDDEMSHAYQQVLLRVDNPEAVRIEQRDWIKKRNACEDADCVKGAYEMRFFSLHVREERKSGPPVPSRGKTLESHLFAHEADKMSVIRNVISTHNFVPSTISETPYCAQFLGELRTGKVTAVEPNVQALSAYDPALGKWRQCEGKELKDVHVAHPDEFFDFIGTLGQPPYRYYKIDLDGNQNNGQEDVLYHETSAPYYDRTNAGVGRTGYTWVDLNACVIRSGVPMSSMYLSKNAPSSLYRLNLIAKHEEDYVALELFPLTKDAHASNYYFRMTTFPLPPSRKVCSWHEPLVETTAP